MQDWLPDAALLDHSLPDALFEAVSDWRAAWMSDQDLHIHTLGFHSARPRVRHPLTILDPNKRFWVCAARQDRLAWSGALINLHQAEDDLSDADIAFHENTYAKCLSQFCSVLAHALGEEALPVEVEKQAPKSEGEEVLFGMRLSSMRTVEVIFGVRRDLATRLRKRLAPSFKARTQPVSLTHALADHRIQLGVRLGGAELKLSEVRNLEIGDVIALDRRFEDALALVVDGAVNVPSPCYLAEKDGQFDIYLKGTE